MGMARLPSLRCIGAFVGYILLRAGVLITRVPLAALGPAYWAVLRRGICTLPTIQIKPIDLLLHVRICAAAPGSTFYTANFLLLV